MKHAYWSPDRLREYQNKKLRRILRYAYEHVPFYHNRFREHRIKPNEIRTAADLNKLSILRKEEIRKGLDQVISRKYNKARLKIDRTSGSTGKPLHFYISGKEDEYRKAKHLRANISVGQKPRDKWVVVVSPLHFGEVTKFQRFLGIYVATTVSVFNDLATQISKLEELEPNVLDGYSSSILLLAKEIEKRGIGTIKPRFIIGGAEFIGDDSCQFIEKAFDVPFYDQYACDEMERIAWQCPEKIGYHIDADSIIVQFVDENGEEVAPGERGEVVCTSLFNYAMPFIRYAINDIGRSSNEECPCGRTLPLMKVIEGRKDSLIFFADKRVLSPMGFNALMCMFKFHDSIDQYRFIQRKIDFFEFLVKLGSDGVDKRIVEKELVRHLRRTLNVNEDQAKFEVRFVENIPLDKSGKLRKVVSELHQDAMS